MSERSLFTSATLTSRRSWWGLPLSVGIEGLAIGCAIVFPLLASQPPPLSPTSQLIYARPPLELPTPPSERVVQPPSNQGGYYVFTFNPAIEPLSVALDSDPVEHFTTSHLEDPCPWCPAIEGEVIGGKPNGGRPTYAVDRKQAPPPPSPVRPGGNIAVPRKIHHVAPVYPSVAIQAHVSGTVILETVIDRDGSVKDIRVLRSEPLLDTATIKAVSQWRYEPTRLNGVAVPVIMTVTVTFKL